MKFSDDPTRFMIQKPMIEIGALIEVSTVFQHGAIFRVRELNKNFPIDQRLPVMAVSASQFQDRFLSYLSEEWLWALSQPLCGDSPTQYHPKFLMALLSSLSARTHNQGHESFLQWQFPAIRFETEEWTRRSMTLNGMRMSTEYFAHDSPRVLQLIEQRLEAGQADVVHNVLVYLMQSVLETHIAFDEERALQAESLAAYLELDADRVQALLFEWPLQTAEFIHKIETGFAGTPRSLPDISALIENQLARFSVSFQEIKNQEDKAFGLIDEVVACLYNHDRTDC